MNTNNSLPPAFQTVSSGKIEKSVIEDPAPHCTNPNCPYFHFHDPEDRSWRAEHGTYETEAFGTVSRYRCRHCGKTFSTQSFSIDYWVHYPVDYIPLLISLVSSTGFGNMTRFTGLRCELIQNRYERLCRVFLGLHAALRENLSFNEDFVLDGFESFSVSQYFPNNINILTGASSELIYGMSYAQLRRKGSMTAKQKLRREEIEKELGKPSPKAVENAVVSLLKELCKSLRCRNLGRKILKTDMHKAYPRALARIPESHTLLDHQQFSSKTARTPTNPLFSVNYTDRQFRKDQSDHTRESVQFARCPSAMMTRLTIYQIYHNYLMPRRVHDQRQGNWQTRGEFLGIKGSRIQEEIQRIWGRRAFLNKTPVWESERLTWLMQWDNVGIPLGRYRPKYIFA